MVYLFENLSQHALQDIEFLYHNVSIERYEKAIRYRRALDKMMSLIAYSLLEYGLYKEHGIILSKNTQFKKTQYGKPFLKEHKDIYFNMSHCKKGVVCAIHKNRDIGIDIQDVITIDEGLVNYVCSDGEKNLIVRANNEEQWFSRFWSLKESYVKYLGTGINSKLNSLDFSKHVDKYFDMHQCKFSVFPSQDYTLSICTDKYVLNDELHSIDLYTLKNFYNNLRPEGNNTLNE